jgi:Cysteine-rich CWC
MILDGTLVPGEFSIPCAGIRRPFGFRGAGHQYECSSRRTRHAGAFRRSVSPMTTTAESIDPHRCPICGRDNQCAVARGRGACWCFTRPIPDAVLEQVPEAARERACVCETCASGRRDPAAVFRRIEDILRIRRGG